MTFHLSLIQHTQAQLTLYTNIWHTHLTPWRHTTRSKPLPRLALCSDSHRKKRFNHGSKLARWKNDSSGHNVHVRAISTHYVVIWKVMELKPAQGMELPRAPRAPGPKSGSTCCLTTHYQGNTEGWGWQHELWVNVILWICCQTSLRAMKRGVPRTKSCWIHVYIYTQHKHTHRCHHTHHPCVLASSCDLLWARSIWTVICKHVIATPWASAPLF